MIPSKLKLKNFLSHDISEIDFNTFDLALILGMHDGNLDSSNSSGKSSLFEAITWALFGKSRHKKKDGVVKWDKKDCEVKFEFSVDETKFKVVRSRDKIISDSDVSLWQWNNATNTYEDISCDNNHLTDEKIVKTIGFNYEVFVNSIYFKQDDVSMFTTTTAGKRKDILKSLLKMEQWDDYQKRAKDKARELQTKIEEKTARLVPIETLRGNIEECKEQVLTLRKQIKDGNQEADYVNSILIDKKSHYRSTYGTGTEDLVLFNQIKQEHANTKERLKKIILQQSVSAKNIQESTGQIAVLQQRLGVLKEKINGGKGINLNDLRSKIVGGRTKERLLKEKVATLSKNVTLSGECDLCKKPLNKKDADEIQKHRELDLKNAKALHLEVQQKLSRAEEKLKQKELAVSDATKAELEKSKIEVRIAKLQSVVTENTSLNAQLVTEKQKIESRDFEKELATLSLRLNKQDEEALSKEIDELEKRSQELKRKLDKLNVEYGTKFKLRDDLLRGESEQNELQKDINKIKDEYSIYDKLKDYFGKDGIQSIIIENVIEELENYSNDTLTKICNEPTSISIVTQKQNENGSWAETFDINIKEGSRIDDFDTLSGGGKFRVSLAIRLALSNILSKRMGGTVKFLLMDEVATSLDKKGMETFMDVVKQLSKLMKILVITHNDDMKKYFSDIIVVEKTSSGSKAYVQ